MEKTEIIDPGMPPRDLTAEKAVLGGMMQDEKAAVICTDMLVAADFYSSAHEKIFAAMLRLSAKSEKVDIITVGAALGSDLNSVGGNYYLSELVALTPSAANIEHHANIVLKMRTLRKLGAAGYEIQSYANEAGADDQYVLEQAEKLVFDIHTGRRRGGFVKVYSTMTNAFERIEGFHQHQDGITGVPTGLVDLDAITAGFQKSDLVIIAARPSVGKTSLALTSALNAVFAGFKVGFFSLEMAAHQLALRLLCMDSKVDSHAMRRGKLTKPDFARLAMSVNKFAECKLFIDDTAGLSINELRARARRLKMEEDIDAIYVDYLQLIHMSGRDQRRYENRTQEVTLISSSLKELARDLDIPVIALSQLSRAVETRGGDKRPILSDLRESGAIEQDADVVAFIYRPEVYDRVEHEGESEVIIAKQRNGPLDTAKLMYHKKYTLFANLAKSSEPKEHYLDKQGESDSRPPF